MPDFKRCSKCGALKTRAHFYNDKRKRDGRKSYCKACASAASQARRAADLDGARASERAWNAAARRRHPDRIKGYRAADYAKHRDSYLVRAKKWAEENPERRSEICRTYRLRNHERVIENERRCHSQPERQGRHNAKSALSQSTGVPMRLIPTDLADAKALQLGISRLIAELKRERP